MSGPNELKVGRVTFPICQLGDGRVMAWWKEGSRRRRVGAPNVEKLKAKLQRIAVQLLNGEIDAAQLEAADHRAYLVSRAALEPFGIAVDLAVREYAAAREILGDVSIAEAARFYRRNAGVEIEEKKAAEIVTEFVVSLAGRSESYYRVTDQDLAHFVRQFGERVISDIKTAELEKWLLTLGRQRKGANGELIRQPLGKWRRKQVIGTLITLFSFARSRRYLMPGRDTAAEAMTREKCITEAKAVWDPGHLERALSITDDKERAYLPWLVLSAFKNLRTGAILRMEWHKHFHWDDNLLELPAMHSKTGTRAVVPITPQMKNWLAPWIGKAGRVCEVRDVGDFTDRLRTKYGIPYEKNILRRSFISYRLAETNNESLVAEEANTSVKKLRSNYRQVRTLTGKLVTPKLAQEWFGVLRVDPDKVIQLDLAIA